jgi:hypothetical protein
MMRRDRRHSWAIVFACATLAGCGSGGERHGKGDAGSQERSVQLPYVGPAPAGTRKVTRLEDLTVDRSVDFRLKLPYRSLATVEHYDELLARQGWEKVKAGLQQAGQRQWMTITVGVGITDGYDAAWRDPKTGRTALLNIWYRAEDKNLQYGNFELHEKEDAEAPPGG